ncbi:hypothetical protein J7481_22895 [Labrenzia sp. R4_2]|uniref:hypothetical protein n=1 Tax=Labrenzia sp. R4_2 TaxID=2821107 RepID=UPI001ADB5183|nr:hypothetical protein [Labrenzia sp. R4_2]MBO9422376.1 hypothetical protein [Labrenzia sp. R4_2]
MKSYMRLMISSFALAAALAGYTTPIVAETKAERHQRILDYANEHKLDKVSNPHRALPDVKLNFVALGMQCEKETRSAREECILDKAARRKATQPNWSNSDYLNNEIFSSIYAQMKKELGFLILGRLERFSDKDHINKDFMIKNDGMYNNLQDRFFFCPDLPEVLISFKEADLKNKKYIENTLKAHITRIAKPQPLVRCIENGDPKPLAVSVYANSAEMSKFTIPVSELNLTANPDAIERITRRILNDLYAPAENVLAASNSGADGKAIPSNPFASPRTVNGQLHNHSDLLYVYDGNFRHIPLPLEGADGELPYLRSIVVNFFSGIANLQSRECHPAGMVRVPWKLNTYSTDAFGNKTLKNSETHYSTMAPEVVSTFKANVDNDLYTPKDVAPAVRDLIRQYGCKSAEYQHLYRQILALNKTLANGFDRPAPVKSEDLKAARQQVLKFVNVCADDINQSFSSSVAHCTCIAYVRNDILYSGKSGPSKISKEESSRRFDAECRGRFGTNSYRKPIMDLAREMLKELR